MIAVTGREMAYLTEDTSDFKFHSQALAKDAHSGEAEVRPPAERGLLAAGRAQRRRRRTEGVESSTVGRGGGTLQVVAAREEKGRQEGQEGRQDGGRGRGREEGQGREGRGRLPGELKHKLPFYFGT